MLDATLSASESDGDVDLALTVENTGDDPVTLSFRDGQRAEYVAERADGSEVWRYSDGRGFTMALGTEELAPGDTVTYEATWHDPPSGDYTVRAWVVAADADAADETAVAVA
ncbi:MAG: BsuPI-related putative proteinase inhibitor [Halobacterium sp.]